jgi:spore coat protein CotH
MQPAPPEFGGPGNPPPRPRNDRAPRASEQNLFGMAFPWARAEFTAEGQKFKDVSIRYAGEITYFVTAQSLKRPFLVRVEKTGQQLPWGIASLQLHAMPLDPAMAREVLACSVFRAAGVPTPRTAFAEVTLSIEGKYDQEYLGLYTVVEGVDETFLADRFGTGKGLLMKPARVRGIDFLGDDWRRYVAAYRPQRAATEDEARRVIDFARLVNQATDAEFRKQIDSFLEVDAFLRFMAANALTANLESFFALGQNYHLYLEPRSNKLAFIPGDLEFSFANFLLMGSPEQLMDLSLTKPYPGENKLPDRLLAIPEVRERYEKLLQEMAAAAFTTERLLGNVAAIETATRPAREREARAVAGRGAAWPGVGTAGGT